MKLRNLPGYALVAMAIASVVVAVTGCGVSEPPTKQVSVPDLGGHVILAYVDSGNKAITLYEGMEVACIENTRSAYRHVSHTQDSAFSCWSIDTAPKKIQELVKRHKAGCDVGLSC